MLSELHIENLGVIDAVDLVLADGLTAITGETGAGKTMLVEALDLVVGGRADPLIVRPGAAEARVDARFVSDDGERSSSAASFPPRAGPAPTSTAVRRRRRRSPTWRPTSSTSTASTPTSACCRRRASGPPSTPSAAST